MPKQLDTDAKGRTADRILDLAEKFIQTRGYSAFSYQDIADALGIRKASIHHHFASKTDLGIATIERYTKRFGDALAEVAADERRSSAQMLDLYIRPYRDFAGTADLVCLCGALAGELLALPPDLRARVDRFFRQHQTWLAAILKRGVARGEWKLRGKPMQVARLVFGALQGALIVGRTTGDRTQLRDVVAMLKADLGRP